MRSLLQHGILIAGVAFLGALPSPAAAQGRRPVVAPGQQVPARPPPPPALVPAAKPGDSGEAEAKKKAPAPADAAAAAAAAAPAEPAAPVDFNDAGQLVKPAPVPLAAEPIGLHSELRYTRRSGDFVYVMSVRPGEPKAGDQVELFFRINELLPIPDPALGDRRPLEGGRLTIRVKGGGTDRSYVIHELDDAGTYGAHFTAAGQGVYDLEIERTDGRRAQKLALQLGIGVKTPGLASAEQADPARRRGRDGVTEGVEMFGVAAPDQSSIAGVMNELGRRWMELERHAGTPAAAEAAAAVHEQALLVAGKAPQVEGGHAAEFDQLAATLVGQLAGWKSTAADRGAILSAMARTRDDVCMRCHAMYRLQIADSVASWPDFSARQNLEQPSEAPQRRGTRTRTPFGVK